MEDHVHEEPEIGTIQVPRNVIDVIGAAPSGQEILQTCIDIAVFLAGKNIAYGDSALNPVRLFSKSGPTEQLLVRIDDKLSRFLRGNSYPGDDDMLDLVGYIILYMVAQERERTSTE